MTTSLANSPIAAIVRKHKATETYSILILLLIPEEEEEDHI